MANRKLEKREVSTVRIYESALREFAEKGLYGAYLSDIAAGAGVSKGLLSQRFGSREHLLAETLRYNLVGRNPFEGTDGSIHAAVEQAVTHLLASAAVKDCYYHLIHVLSGEVTLPVQCDECLREWFFNCSSSHSEELYRNYLSYLRAAGSIVIGFTEAGRKPPEKNKILALLDLKEDTQKRNLDTAASLVGDYGFICRINARTREVTVCRVTHDLHEDYGDKFDSVTTYQGLLDLQRSLIYPGDLEEFESFASQMTDMLDRRIDTTILHSEFRSSLTGSIRYYRIKCVLDLESRFASVGIVDRDETVRRDLSIGRRQTIRAEQANEARALQVMTELTDEYESIIYVDLHGDALSDDSRLYRVDPRFVTAIPGWTQEYSFHNRLEKMYEYMVHPDDRERFYEETRRARILGVLTSGNNYYIEFRTLIDGKVGHFQMRFLSTHQQNGDLTGFVVGLHDIDREVNRVREERKNADIINVLSNEYTAVYYVDYENGKYDILYQLDHVKQSVNTMLDHFPSYTDAFLGYVEMLVHPDDKRLMRREISLIPEHLQHNKSFTVEFRRNYAGEYLYTEMKCVKVGAAEEKLTAFVVGFAENDAQYRSYLDRQKQLEQAVLERTAELHEKNLTLSRLNEEIIELLGTITEARDTESGRHIRRVKNFVRIIAGHVMQDWPEYRLTPATVELISSASALHDIGKIVIPDTILLKPGKLTPAEFAIMQTHCEKGYEILQHAPADWSNSYLQMSCDICRYHHEKYDGKGYPFGLKGDSIPISAQIVSLADCFDALISKRTYKDPVEPETAFRMILEGKCGTYSSKMLDSFIKSKDELFRLRDSHPDEDEAHPVETDTGTGSLSWTHLLLADDNTDSCTVNSDILEGEGALVVRAAGGEEAVRIFAESDPDTFDAVLLDVMMPDIDGVTAAGRIRDLDRPDARRVPIFGITAQGSDEEMNRCVAGGMDSYLTKPVSIARFNKVLYECLEKHSDALDNAVKRAEEAASSRLDQALKTSDISGFGTDYELLCYINGTTNDVSGYKASPELQAVINTISLRLPSNRRLDLIFRTIIPPSEFRSFVESAERHKVTSYLENHSSYQTFVPVQLNGKSLLYRMMIKPDRQNPGCYMLGLYNTDTEDKEDLRMRELVQKLAESYITVNYVDLEKDIFRCYQSQTRPVHETDCFSRRMQFYIARSVHADDREMVTAATGITQLRERLRMNKRITLRFRHIDNGIERYYEMQFVNTEGDDTARFAMFTLSDIDDIVRKEMMASRLMQNAQTGTAAEINVIRDPLTGAGNISSYTEAVNSLSEAIRTDPYTRFGIVICDIDCLQKINADFGHDTGDRCIRSCCSILTSVFTAGSVYRIDGDKFAVILTGADYEHRDALMEKLNRCREEAVRLPEYENGKTSFSAGLAVYDSFGHDTVADVIRRADISMFTQKLAR